MSLAADLEKLQRQKQSEIRTLHQTYLRTKRSVVRNASPGRLVRRHMGVSLAVAAAMGLLFAPRPSPAAPPTEVDGIEEKAPSGLANSLGRIKSLVGRFVPQVAAYIPGPPPPDADASDHQAPEKPKNKPAKKGPAFGGIFGTLVKELAALALSKIDFHALIAEAMKQFSHGQKHKENGTSQDSPHVSVANAGTVEPHDYENFQ